MKKIKTKSDVLSFLYNFEKFAENEGQGRYLLIFPKDQENEQDLIIYKEQETWSIIENQEIAPGIFAVEKVSLRQLVDKIYKYKEKVNILYETNVV